MMFLDATKRTDSHYPWNLDLSGNEFDSETLSVYFDDENQTSAL